MVGVVLLCLGEGVNLLDWLRVVGIVCFVLGKSASELLRVASILLCFGSSGSIVYVLGKA